MFSLTLFIFIFTFIQSHTFHIYISLHSAHSSVAHIKLHCPHNRCPIVSLSPFCLLFVKRRRQTLKRREGRHGSEVCSSSSSIIYEYMRARECSVVVIAVATAIATDHSTHSFETSGGGMGSWVYERVRSRECMCVICV